MTSTAAIVIVVALIAVAVLAFLTRFTPVREVLVKVPGLRAVVRSAPEPKASISDRKGTHRRSKFTATGDARVEMQQTRTTDSTFEVFGGDQADRSAGEDDD